jgi:hypothetical protein
MHAYVVSEDATMPCLLFSHHKHSVNNNKTVSY